MNKKIQLKPGREEALLRRHPWIFSGAIEKVEGQPDPGETILVCAADGRVLGQAAWSPSSQIRARMWHFDQETAVDAHFIRKRIERSVALRGDIRQADVDACRLIYSESDGLPGLVVDQYADVLVCQFLTTGAEYWRNEIIDVLKDIVPCSGIYERSDSASRAKEGLGRQSGLISGKKPDHEIEIHERASKFLVNVYTGHKTGFYLDQRDNRSKLSRYASGRTVLNCFAYTGAFAVAALHHGASRVINIDSSGPALETAERIAGLNGYDSSQMENIEADVFQMLRQFAAEGKRFDLIILDPPKFVENKGHIKKAARAYKDINMYAFKLLESGGLLYTFSCSGLLEPGLFQKIVADAALDAGRPAQIIERLGQSGDHPIALNFPEADYLKGLCIRVLD